MKRIVLGLLLLIGIGASAQTPLYTNSVINLKNGTPVYKFHYLNNTDSIVTIDSVGVNFIRAARFKAGTTAQRPAFAVAGMLRYNSDSSALEYYDGSLWQKLSIAAGVSTPALQSVLTAGSTLSTNNTITVGTNTFAINSNSGVKFNVSTGGLVSIGGTNNAGYNFFINGQFGAESGTGAIYFNGATSTIFTSGTASLNLRLIGNSKEFRQIINTTDYTIAPYTDNTLPYRIKNFAGTTLQEIDFANSLFKVNAIPAATSNDTKLVVRGSSDSAFRQLDYPIVQNSYTPTKTDVTNIGTASVTTSYYQRTGNKIEVWGEVTIDPTATGDTQITLSLPIASSMSNSYDLSGSAAAYDVNQSARIYYSGGVAVVRLNATDASSHVYSYRYVYYYFAP